MDLNPMKETSMKRRRLVTLGVATLSLAVAGSVTLAGTGGTASAARVGTPLLSIVTKHDGSPRAGHDPANRPQQSLAQAAGRPASVPVGPKVDGSVGLNPDAVGVNNGRKKQAQSGPRSRVAKPEDVLSEASVTGGCRPEYGPRGECLPFIPPSHVHHPDHDMDQAWTCEEARTLHPRGIRLKDRGTDPLGLDVNGDGIACGAGD
jgi:hypothetical protein